MKIFFDHILGQISDHDWQVSYVYAKVPEHEISDAIEQGWTIDECQGGNIWIQQRQARLNIAQYLAKTRTKSHPNVRYEVVKVPETLDPYLEIQDKYMAKKGFKLKYPLELEVRHDRDNKRIVEIYHNEILVALTVVRCHPYFVSLGFLWDYETPKLRLGYDSLHREVLLAESLGFEHYSLGVTYDDSSLWKTELHGFMWWDGANWRTDRDALRSILVRESSIRHISEISDIAVSD